MSQDNAKNEFLCNISLIKALTPYFPLSDRKIIQEWIKKLQDIEEQSSEGKIRDEYTFYLLFCMQSGTLWEPFHAPPNAKLKPLCRLLPEYVYEEVQKQLKISYCKMNRMLNATPENYEMPDLSCDPSSFRCEQPRPHKGITAAFAVFSNYDDDSAHHET